jgi:hypothetical protein
VSGDLAISSATPVQPTLTGRGTSGGPAFTPTTDPAPAATSSAAGPPLVNPGLHLDPALNLVVLQFFDSQGDVVQSIPSQKQLQAYKQDAGVSKSTIERSGAAQKQVSSDLQS